MSFFSMSSSLTSLDLSGWNMSNVTNMRNMFRDCSSLTSLDISGWNTENFTDINKYQFMFRSCTNLKTIRMVDCSSVTINKIKAQLATDGITGYTIVTE